MVIDEINGEQIVDAEQFLLAMQRVRPEEKITIGTDKGDFELVTAHNPENEKMPYLGVSGIARSDFINDTPLNRRLYNILSWFQQLVL